jgi:hypothetical protein
MKSGVRLVARIGSADRVCDCKGARVFEIVHAPFLMAALMGEKERMVACDPKTQLPVRGSAYGAHTVRIRVET